MKALVYEGPREMTLEEIEAPVPGPEEILIRVCTVGICGSELSGYLGENSLRKPPLVMGHEFSGTVADLGDRVSEFAVGDSVTANPLVSCWRCSLCKMGKPNLCPRRELIGAHRPGAYAEYVVVPERNVHLLSRQLSMDEAALAEPLACAVHACRLAQVSPTDRMLVAGAGPIGLLIMLTAGIFGLEDIVVMDINEERLEIVHEFGGLAARSAEEVQAATPSQGFDVTMDAVGMNATRHQCIDVLHPGGRAVFSGLHAAESVLSANEAVRNELSIQGAFAYTERDFELALRWLGEKKVSLAQWTIHASLEDGGAWFDKLISNPGKVAKVLLELK